MIAMLPLEATATFVRCFQPQYSQIKHDGQIVD